MSFEIASYASDKRLRGARRAAGEGSWLALLALLSSACGDSPRGPASASGGTGAGSGGIPSNATGGAEVTSGGLGGAAPADTGGSVSSGGKGGSSGGKAAMGGGPTTATGGGPTTGGVSPGAGNAGNNSGGSSSGAGGAVTGGNAGASTVGGAGSGDAYVTGVTVKVHADVSTVLVVTWTQSQVADQTWLEFSFENGAAMTSRPSAGASGAHQDVVLGVPEKTEVTLRVVSKKGGVEYKTRDYKGTTGAVPTGLPAHQVLAYDAAIASKDRWMIGAVEDSIGGKAGECCYWSSTWWTYIMDRRGRVVWYYADPARNPTSSFPRKARDGEYLFMEKRPFSTGGSRSVLKMTLDHRYFEDVPVSGLSDCVDMTASGSLLYDANNELREMTRDGKVRTIWSCPQKFGQSFRCYSNTVNWNPLADTVLMSFPEERTVVEINRQTGELVGQYGSATGSYAFSPTWTFEYQHFANITAAGTLLVSSHMPGFTRDGGPVAGKHAFIEFEIDRANKTLIQKWLYNEAPEWANSRGMAIRMPNGNTLANFGPQGVIREITPDKKTAFHVKFDVATGDDFFNKMVGHNELIDDLYAYNGGGPK
ncbi:MAG TPA: hypothetical protein VG937_26230 [Polyangiaceae bacterium]|nr:hypothetical protein [Polyangiaceae bacterium]